MMHRLPVFIARYWIAVAVLLFALLSAYTSNPIYGQTAPPTPDINTVPPIELLQTPTNTPFPTPTPVVEDEQPGGNELDPTATPFFNEPTATPQANNDNSGGGSSSGGSGGSGSGSGGSGGSSSGSGSSDSGNTGNPTESAPTTGDISQLSGLTGIVNPVTLNIRKGPSTEDSIIDTLFRNEPVTILARDSANMWWYVCCGTGAGREGWVSAELITPNFDRNEAESLLPVTATTRAQTAAGSDATAAAVVLEMRPSPAFAWQGQTVQLQFVVSNTSDQPLTNIRLRNDLPPTLAYLTADIGQQGTVQESGEAKDGLIYTILWPALAARESLTATVTLQLEDDIPNGALVDNLAVVDTAEGTNALAGITFAMPPLRLPQFR